MDDPVVVRRLREVGQKFSTNRRTVIITAPAITIPTELGSLVEFLEFPLPDKQRLRQIIDEGHGKGREDTDIATHNGYPPGLDAMANNLCGLDRGRSRARGFAEPDFPGRKRVAHVMGFAGI